MRNYNITLTSPHDVEYQNGVSNEWQGESITQAIFRAGVEWAIAQVAHHSVRDDERDERDERDELLGGIILAGDDVTVDWYGVEMPKPFDLVGMLSEIFGADFHVIKLDELATPEGEETYPEDPYADCGCEICLPYVPDSDS